MTQLRKQPGVDRTGRRSWSARGLAVAALGCLGLLAGAGRAAADTAVFNNAASIAINDHAAAGTYPSIINVASLAGPVTRVSVTLRRLTHSAPEDVDVLLVGPGGQKVFLMGDAGRTDPVSDVILTFDDSGPPLPNRRIRSGTFRPTNRNDRGSSNDTFPGPAPGGPYASALSAFNGTDPNGDWRLFIRDDAASDSGTLAGGWCLAITTGGGAPTAGCIPTLTVVKVGQGTVTSQPRGINCGSDCQEGYVDGTVVTLRATAAPSFTFFGWSGGGCSGTGNCVLTMTAAVTVTATFVNPANTSVLSVNRAGGGTVTSNPTGIDCGLDCAEAFTTGIPITLTAVPDPSFAFSGWSGGGCSGTGTCQVTMDQDRAVTATFAAPPGSFTLSVTTVGSGTVTSEPAGIDCGLDCTEAYSEGTGVTLTATPAPSFLFAGWSGGGCSGIGTCQVTMDQDKAVTATFTAPPGSSTLTVVTDGSGTVTSNPIGISCVPDCQENYPADTDVVLTATPNPSFVFVGWSGGGCESAGTDPCTVTLSGDEEVTASFAAAPGAFTLTVSTAGAGTVTSNPGGIDCGSDCAEAYPDGTPVTLTATPAPSFLFAGWSGGGCSGTEACVVTMTADTPISATFTAPAGSFALTVLKQGAGTGTVTSAPAGIDCGDDCAEAFPAGTPVTLTATPAPSFVFVGWSGAGCSGAGTCVATMNAGVLVAATFAAPPGSFALTVLKQGSGDGTVTSAPAGIDCGDDCAEAFPAGTPVTLRAAPAPSFVFAGWSGGGCSGTGDCQVTLTGNLQVSATFTAPAGASTLRVRRSGLGLGRVTSQPAGITCGADCAEAYPDGTGVTLTAIGRRGSVFTGWSGGGCTGSAPCALTLTADTVLAAAINPPGDRPLITIPEEDDVPVAPGDVLPFSWVGFDRSTQYGFEFTGPNLPFTNPLGPGPDGVNGFGGAGGGFIVPGTGTSIAVPLGIAPGVYQVRVIGLSPEVTVVGRMSDAVTFLVGGQAGDSPAITLPASGTVVPRGSALTVAWTPVAGAAQYLFTFEGGPDPGLIGGGFLVPANAISGTIPLETPAGEYRVRVIGLTAGGAPVGGFSTVLTLDIQ